VKLQLIIKLVNGKVITKIKFDINIDVGLTSDLMSDILTLDVENAILITGLNNLQTIRTMEMSDIHCVIIGRGKKVSPEMIQLAEKCNITIIESPFTVFKISGLLFSAGIEAVY
jgi:serine kinase of HPr protein (carbohydrate metabolism regulator)